MDTERLTHICSSWGGFLSPQPLESFSSMLQMSLVCKGCSSPLTHLSDSCWAFHLTLALPSSRWKAFLEALNETRAPCQRLSPPGHFSFSALLTCKGPFVCVRPQNVHSMNVQMVGTLSTAVCKVPIKVPITRKALTRYMWNEYMHTDWDLTAHHSSSQE